MTKQQGRPILPPTYNPDHISRKTLREIQNALKAQCYHNTGEGGVSSYHCNGADIVWQLGTGYFGARDKNGEFSLEKFNNTVLSNPNIKMIEIKLSQGAKPAHGGILPAAKVTPEIARIRKILS